MVSTRSERTREVTVAAMESFAREHGRTPSVADWNRLRRHDTLPSVQTITRVFGSWRQALEAAGLEMRTGGQQVQWSRATLVDLLHACVDELGDPNSAPTALSWIRWRAMRGAALDAPTSTKPYERSFGSWHAALEAAGFEPTRAAPGRDAMIDRLRELASHDSTRLPSQARWKTADQRRDPTDRISVARVVAEFGTWLNALEAAGLDVAQARNRPEFTSSDVIDALTSWHAEDPRGDRSVARWNQRERDPDRRTGISVQRVRSLFGSWRAAVEAADLPPCVRRPGVRPSRDTIVAALRSVARSSPTPDVAPTLKAWPSHVRTLPADEQVTLTEILDHYGTWSAAITDAGLLSPRGGGRGAPISPAMLIEHLRSWSHAHSDGVTGPTVAQWRHHAARVHEAQPPPGLKRYLTAFGTWNRAHAAAGLRSPRRTPTEPSTRWTRESVVELLIDRFARDGVLPLASEWHDEQVHGGSIPSIAVIGELFGSFPKALRIAAAELRDRSRRRPEPYAW